MSPLTLKFGGYQAPASIHNRAAQAFGDAMKARLGDRIKFELIGSVIEQLNRPSGDLPVMVEAGELDFCYISTVRFSKPVPEMQLIELPFLVKDRKSVQAAFDGALGDVFKKRMLESTPFRLLGIWDNGFRHFTNKVRPIRTPADCKGLRTRAQVSDIHVEVFKALGFEPIPVDVKEFAEQVTTDRFQAQENPLTNTYNFGVHHVHRYITLTGHLFGAAAFICNEKRYESWPADVRRAVDESAKVATAEQHRLGALEDAEILAKIDPKENDVIELTPAERAQFVAAVQPVLEKYRKALGPELFRHFE
jgi:TRAP-type C4-dicarboxylate transport system substrate-binding protein